MADKLLSPQKSDQILKKYIDDMNNYKPDQHSLEQLLNSSRLVSAVLSSHPDKLDIVSHGKPLKDAYLSLLNNLEEEKIPNKKLL